MDIKEVLKLPEYDFLKKDKRLKGNIMLLTFGGSHAYGTNNEHSDIDIRGITLPTKEDLLYSPFITLEEDNLNKNLIFGPLGFEQYNDTKTDTVIYGLDKMMKQLYKCNPNTIEILGCKPEHYACISKTGQILLDNHKMFLSKLAYKSFLGYGKEQLVRLKNALAKDSMSLVEKQFYMKDVINRMYDHLEMAYPSFNRDFIKFNVTDKDGNFITLKHNIVSLDELCFVYNGNIVTSLNAKEQKLDLNNTDLRMDINIENMTIRDISGVYNEIYAVLKNFTSHIGHRNKKKDDYHLNKHAMHLIRLYLMCFDIFIEQQIITYREKDLNTLLPILHGEFQKKDGSYNPKFYKMVDDMEKKLLNLYETSKLPDRPDDKKVLELSYNIKETVFI